MSRLLIRYLVYSVSLLLPLGVAGRSVSDPETLTIFVKGDSPALEPARAEVARLMEPAGYTVDWKNLKDRKAGEDYANLVVVELRGTCMAPMGATERANPKVRALASTSIVDGRVLPFSIVECDSLRAVMSRTQVGIGLFGRAMGRVIAHELYHMLTEKTAHADSGVSKSCFSISDLLSDHFEFDHRTLAHLQPQPQKATGLVARPSF